MHTSDKNELLPHLFRTEYRKIVSVLIRRFGFEQIEVAEDIASDTFVMAAQTWGVKGLPPHPTAWLYTVAGNKAKSLLKRDALFRRSIIPELAAQEAVTEPEEIELDFSPGNMNDSQLRMMFALCHPSISPEGQIGLSLRILCGFGIDEIADAFLTTRETINKRLFRAKEKLREQRINIEFPSAEEMDRRLESVLRTMYLLFSEGYYSISQTRTIRQELCFEAMRLCAMLTENEATDKPEANALLALMCFHASRFDARLNSEGEIVLYEDQDRALWDENLVNRGVYHLHRASGGSTLSRYHLEAAIAYWHTQWADEQEKWENILQLHNQLLQLEYSPIAALNRTYALSKVKGKQAAIAEAEKLKLTGNQFYFVLLGELYRDVDNRKARAHFREALRLVKTATDRQILQRKIDSLPADP